MRRPTILEQIRALDPERDHERIVFLSTCYEFSFDTTRALEFALFRTFCVPRIARLLDGTGEFRNRAQKRYDDTDIIVSELMEHGYSSERGSRALARMNAQHGRFKIANDDFRYVLSTFIYEPIRWNARFGWRKMCQTERLAHFHFWLQVGERMESRIFRPITPLSNATTSPMNNGTFAIPKPAAAWAPRQSSCSRTGFRGSSGLSCAARCTRSWMTRSSRASAFRNRHRRCAPLSPRRCVCGRDCYASCPPAAIRVCAPRCATAP